MASPPLDVIYSALRDIRTTRYAQLAASSIILFDHLITLDDEINLVWGSSWSIGKLLFVINRYYTLVSFIFNNYALFGATLTDSFCHRYFQWQGWTGLIGCMIAEVILQMRLYALYYLDKKILTLMASTFLVASAVAAAILGHVLSNLIVTANPLPEVNFCFSLNIPAWFFTFWIPIIAFESLLCGLALYRGYQTFRSEGSPFQSGRHLVSILIRDSVLYFLVMFATYFTNMLMWLAADIDLLEVPIAFSIALSCCLGNRLILNVRRVNRDLELEKSQRKSETRPGVAELYYDSSSTLTEIELGQLRSMRADQSFGQFVAI